jgi:hypothetical protein
LVYLSCDVPSSEGFSATHYDFTLDEQNGEVSIFVKKANALSKKKALFGPETVTWTTELPLGDSYITQTINRVTLVFTDETVLAGQRTQDVGTCSVVQPPERKF